MCIRGLKKAKWAQRGVEIERAKRAVGEPAVVKHEGALGVRERGVTGVQRRATVISFDEMWAYVGARRGGKRRSVWIWTAVVVEANGERWLDFEVGGRDEGTFLSLYERLPEADVYRSDAYVEYQWLPRSRHKVGKGSEMNRNEGAVFGIEG